MYNTLFFIFCIKCYISYLSCLALVCIMLKIWMKWYIKIHVIIHLYIYMLTILEYVEMLFGFVPWHPLSRIKMMMPPVSCSVDSFPRCFECTQLFSRSWIWILLQSLQRETWNPSQVVWNLPSVRAIGKLKADWIAPQKPSKNGHLSRNIRLPPGGSSDLL